MTNVVRFLILDEGLYKPLEITNSNFNDIQTMVTGSMPIQFDCYCVDCKREATFRSEKKGSAFGISNNLEAFYKFNSGSHSIQFSCQRDFTHRYTFNFLIKDYTIYKIGQYPSIADLELPAIQKYRKILSSDYQYFSKAIGLFANGIGIGSFVYLRRIFENLIYESRDLAVQTDPEDFDIETFNRSKMIEKIKQLGTDYLPEFVVNNRSIYGIISKGIHELSEDDCKEIFPVMKLSIELILDEKLAQIQKEQRVQEAQRAISKIHSDLTQQNH
ncbi:hypothetical protein YS9_2278 [Enterococcus sp. C1]|uniref:hypothetical protein n=1 Tax=Enterococcus sp. C1 TaxID=1182762 RepID=UPI00027227DC|nr:hypothetical protein [Enterococcus sp. C1]EJF48895.1 hypothetical protein YS9_2278 [Enterococcus sp. C1]